MRTVQGVYVCAHCAAHSEVIVEARTAKTIGLTPCPACGQRMPRARRYVLAMLGFGALLGALVAGGLEMSARDRWWGRDLAIVLFFVAIEGVRLWRQWRAQVHVVGVQELPRASVVTPGARG